MSHLERSGRRRVDTHPRVRLLAVALLCVAPATAAARGGSVFGPTIGELRLALELPEADPTRGCGGLCGLTYGQRVEAVLLVENTGRRARRVALELSCSGYETTLTFVQVAADRSVKKEPPRQVGLQKQHSCRANAPRYQTLKPGEVARHRVPFVIPTLPPAIYAVTARSQVVPEDSRTITLASAAVRRPIHR